MNLEDETIETVSTKDVTGNNDVELIKKVMQVEETIVLFRNVHTHLLRNATKHSSLIMPQHKRRN